MKPNVQGPPPVLAKPAVVKGPPPAPAKPAVVKGPPPAPAKPAVVKGPPPAPAKPAVVKGPPPAPAKPAVIKEPMNGVNKVDVAKEAAAKAAKVAAEQAAKAAAARRAAITWPKATMTDPFVVTSYVKKTYACWSRLEKIGVLEKPNLNKNLIINELTKVLDEIHKICGVPKVELEIHTANPLSKGTFTHGYNLWRMRINEAALSKDKISKEEFYELLETLYHEGRHAEQAWLVLIQELFEERKWSSHQNKYEVPDTFLFRRPLSEPNNVLQKALDEAVKRREEPVIGDGEIYHKYIALKEKIKKWHESVTKDRSNTECIYQNISMSDHWYHRYQTLPKEYDAFLIQEKVREEFKKIDEFKNVAIQATPGPCRHCHGKNNQHIFSGLPLSKVR